MSLHWKPCSDALPAQCKSWGPCKDAQARLHGRTSHFPQASAHTYVTGRFARDTPSSTTSPLPVFPSLTPRPVSISPKCPSAPTGPVSLSVCCLYPPPPGSGSQGRAYCARGTDTSGHRAHSRPPPNEQRVEPLSRGPCSGCSYSSGRQREPVANGWVEEPGARTQGPGGLAALRGQLRFLRRILNFRDVSSFVLT